jgi:hypothetical protein
MIAPSSQSSLMSVELNTLGFQQQQQSSPLGAAHMKPRKW